MVAAAWRGCVARWLLSNARWAADVLAQSWRHYTFYNWTRRELDAATSIQSVARGLVAMQALAGARRAASTIAARQRGRLAEHGDHGRHDGAAAARERDEGGGGRARVAVGRRVVDVRALVPADARDLAQIAPASAPRRAGGRGRPWESTPWRGSPRTHCDLLLLLFQKLCIGMGLH